METHSNPTQRIVFDTSTEVSAMLKPQSVPVQALSLGSEVAEVVVSNETLDELRQVLDLYVRAGVPSNGHPYRDPLSPRCRAARF